MRRVLSLWLPRLATDRVGRTRPETRSRPLATVAGERGRLVLAAVNRAAEAAGLGPGRTLADARARCPGLVVVDSDPRAELRLLHALTGWCGRYTPWSSLDGNAPGAGIWLDVSGCGHLFGGEAALVEDMIRRLAGCGLTARAAIADSAGAAWAWARFRPPAGSTLQRAAILAPGDDLAAALADLPVAALRLAPALVDTLDRLGLRRIGDLYGLPRAALADRFGACLGRRLDQALGATDEPLSPRPAEAPLEVRLAAPEPVSRPGDIAAALGQLVGTLCARLAREQLGARRLEFALARSDGVVVRSTVGTSRPAREVAHLVRLFAPRLESLDPGPGVETFILSVPVAERLDPAQRDFASAPAGSAHGGELAALIDRLSNRLGLESVRRVGLRASHLPERAVVTRPALDGPVDTTKDPGPPPPPRPVRLLAAPEPVDAEVANPHDAPSRFYWHRRAHRVVRAEGPERIAPEWWREDESAEAADATRDYFRVEDEAGRRFWLCRAISTGGAIRWHVHGVFA